MRTFIEKLKENKVLKWLTDDRQKKYIFRILSIVCLGATAAFFIYGYNTGLFTSVEAIQKIVEKYGILGPLIFILIQIIQVVIPIIPGGVSLLAGVVAFGPVYGFIYNYLGIVIGSIAVFLIARRLGRRFVESRVSNSFLKKYGSWLENEKRFSRLFAIAIFMPVAPDDFLCMLAGLTRMSLKEFTIIILLCKPPSILAYSLGLSTIAAWITRL